MIERDVGVITKYGTMPSFAVCPDGPGAFPPVILYMDAPGYREELRNMARRIAKAGYFCLLPDLYYRLGQLRFDIPRRNDAMSVVIRGAMASLTNAGVTDDTAGMLAFFDCAGQGQAGPGRLRRALHERVVRRDGGGAVSDTVCGGGGALRDRHFDGCGG